MVDIQEQYDIAKDHAKESVHSIGEQAFITELIRLLDICIGEGYFTKGQATMMLTRVAWYATVIGRKVTDITPGDSIGGDAYRCPICKTKQIRAGYKFCPNCRAALRFKTMDEMTTRACCGACQHQEGVS